MGKYEIVNCYPENVPKFRFIGLCYKNSDRIDGMYGAHWEAFHVEGKGAILQHLVTEEFRQDYPEADAFVGLMRNKFGAPDDYFEYWIGMFFPIDTEVPEGFQSVDIDHSKMGICWLKGTEPDIYCKEGECYERIIAEGMELDGEDDGGCYMFERYADSRFCEPDEQGNIILDLGYFVK